MHFISTDKIRLNTYLEKTVKTSSAGPKKVTFNITGEQLELQKIVHALK